MSWNRDSFQRSKQGMYRREKFQTDSLKDRACTYNYWDPEYLERPYYAAGDCPCCHPGKYKTMDQIRTSYLLQLLWKLGVKLPFEDAENELWFL